MKSSRRTSTGLIVISLLWAMDLSAARPADWLLDPSPFKARIIRDESKKEISITNG